MTEKQNPQQTNPAGTAGAVDLSQVSSQAQASPAAVSGSGSGGQPSWVTELSEANFQQTAQLSTRALVLIALIDSKDAPSQQMAEDLARIVNAQEGRALLAIGDVAEHPNLLQAFGIPQAPLVIALIGGKPLPLADRVLNAEQLGQIIPQALQACVQQGITGQLPPVAQTEAQEQQESPEEKAAREAIEAGDYQGAIDAYQQILNNKPDDVQAQHGLAQVELLQRVADMDAAAVRQAAADNPDDVHAQIQVADLDVTGGHVVDAFQRLVNYIAGHFGQEREQARQHLVKLYDVVGVHDPRVNASRQKLSRVLF